MSLVQTIEQLMRQAQKESSSQRTEVLRFVLAQLRNVSIEKRGQGKSEELTEEEALEVLRREAKKRKEAIELYGRGGRADLAKKEEEELAIIQEFLPAQMSQDDIEREVDALRAGGLNEFNPLMRAAMEKMKGRADGKLVSEVVRRKIGA